MRVTQESRLRLAGGPPLLVEAGPLGLPAARLPAAGLRALPLRPARRSGQGARLGGGLRGRRDAELRPGGRAHDRQARGGGPALRVGPVG
eukprot:7540624-Alexandrium_andersonii.AAC.1